MFISNSLFLVTLLIVLCFCSCVFADTIHMDLKSGKTRCVGQNLDEEDEAVFTLSIADRQRDGNPLPGNDLIRAEVRDPNDAVVQSKVLNINGELIDFYVKITTRGVYNMCFISKKGTKPSSGDDSIRVSFTVAYKDRMAGSGRLKFRTDGPGNPSKKVAKEELPALEEMLKNAEDTLGQISKEIDFSRRQEVLLLASGAKLGSQIQWFGYLSIAILVITSLWQIIYLRHFFTSKKLL